MATCELLFSQCQGHAHSLLLCPGGRGFCSILHRDKWKNVGCRFSKELMRIFKKENTIRIDPAGNPRVIVSGVQTLRPRSILLCDLRECLISCLGLGVFTYGLGQVREKFLHRFVVCKWNGSVKIPHSPLSWRMTTKSWILSCPQRDVMCRGASGAVLCSRKNFGMISLPPPSISVLKSPQSLLGFHASEPRHYIA